MWNIYKDEWVMIFWWSIFCEKFCLVMSVVNYVENIFKEVERLKEVLEVGKLLVLIVCFLYYKVVFILSCLMLVYDIIDVLCFIIIVFCLIWCVYWFWSYIGKISYKECENEDEIYVRDLNWFCLKVK